MSKRIAILLLVVLLALPLGMRLAGERTSETPLGQIDFSLALHPTGVSEIYVPLADWGVQVDLFDGPLLLRADPKALDRDNVLRIADGQGSILSESRESLSQGIILLVLQNAIGILFLAALFAFVAAVLFSFPRKKFVRESVLLSAALFSSFLLVALATYSPEKIEEPSFYARGSELEQLIQVIERETEESEGSYVSNFDRVLSGMGNFLSANETEGVSGKNALLFSDLHSNALALSPLQDFSQNKPVFFVGDFAHQGNDAEASVLAERVAALSDRVIAVSGNHDSKELMRALANRGVEVLEQDGPQKKTSVLGMTVMGYRDPLEWKGEDPADPKRVFSFADLEIDREKVEKRKLLRWWRTLSKKPDILLLHQENLAIYLAENIQGEKLTVLTGHTHDPALLRIGDVSIINAGSAGAGGLFGIGSEESEIAGLHFSQDQLGFVDFIAVDPLLGSARAERVNSQGDLCKDSCLYEPSGGDVVRLGN